MSYLLLAQLPPAPDLVCFIRRPDGSVEDLTKFCGFSQPPEPVAKGLIQLNSGPITGALVQLPPITPPIQSSQLDRPPSLPPNNRLIQP